MTWGWFVCWRHVGLRSGGVRARDGCRFTCADMVLDDRMLGVSNGCRKCLRSTEEESGMQRVRMSGSQGTRRASPMDIRPCADGLKIKFRQASKSFDVRKGIHRLSYCLGMLFASTFCIDASSVRQDPRACPVSIASTCCDSDCPNIPSCLHTQCFCRLLR